MTTFPRISTLLGARRSDLVSTAQRAVLEQMSAAVIVIDRHGRIQELNSAAIGLLGKPGQLAAGKMAAEVLSGWPTIGETRLDGPPCQGNMRIRDVGGERVLEVQNTQIRGDDAPLGRLVLIEDVTQRVRLEEERAARKQAEAGRRKAALLADISTRLAHPLELDSILTRLPGSIVPAFADGMVLDLLASSGLGEQRIAADVANARLLRRACPAFDAAAVEPVLLEDVCPATLADLGFDASHVQACQALNICSMMRVPLTVGHQLVGVLYLVASDTGRRFDTADLVFAEDLAERCALAFDNVRLYESLVPASETTPLVPKTCQRASGRR